MPCLKDIIDITASGAILVARVRVRLDNSFTMHPAR